MQRRREQARQSGKKRKFITEKREGDWLLRRNSIVPFWWSPSYTPPRKNSLKGWSHSGRSGIRWSHSFEKIGARENRMPFGQFGQSHRSLRFILCLQGWHNEPSYQWDPIWALSSTTTINAGGAVVRITYQRRRPKRPGFRALGQEDPRRRATHSSILAWRIPWTEEPGGLWSMGSQRVGDDWSDLAWAHTHRTIINYFLKV